MTKITLYGKENCPLCEIAKGIIERLSREYQFEFENVDISRDNVLFEHYKNYIPVVHVNGREVFKGRINEQALKGILGD